MACINFNGLPDYVFVQRYETFLFIEISDFFSSVRMKEFFDTYCEILKSYNEKDIHLYKIASDRNELTPFMNYDITVYNAKSIVDSILMVTQKELENDKVLFYLRGVIETNNICIYLEREFDCVVIGCNNEAALQFKSAEHFLALMNLHEFISMLKHYSILNEDDFLKMQSRWLDNYTV